MRVVDPDQHPQQRRRTRHRQRQAGEPGPYEDTPTARAPARVAWLLGKDQSPAPGHAASAGIPDRARHGRSSSTTSFNASLSAYATTVPAATSTAPARARGSRPRRAVHPTHTSSRPRTSRVPSLAASRTGPAHDGPSAAPRASTRYPVAEAPPETRTASAVPRPPPGASQSRAPAPAAAAAPAVTARRPHPYRMSMSMAPTVGIPPAGHPRRTAGRTPDDRQGCAARPPARPAVIRPWSEHEPNEGVSDRRSPDGGRSATGRG